jgi:hypothetical protein
MSLLVELDTGKIYAPPQPEQPDYVPDAELNADAEPTDEADDDAGSCAKTPHARVERFAPR